VILSSFTVKWTYKSKDTATVSQPWCLCLYYQFISQAVLTSAAHPAVIRLLLLSDITVPSCIPSTHLGFWACGASTWRWHTSKHGSSAPHQRITQPTSWPHVASPIWSSTEQVARPATKRFHPSDWRPLEAHCRLWTWCCNDATALAGYATMMMMMMILLSARPAVLLHTQQL